MDSREQFEAMCVPFKERFPEYKRYYNGYQFEVGVGEVRYFSLGWDSTDEFLIIQGTLWADELGDIGYLGQLQAYANELENFELEVTYTLNKFGYTGNFYFDLIQLDPDTDVT